MEAGQPLGVQGGTKWDKVLRGIGRPVSKRSIKNDPRCKEFWILSKKTSTPRRFRSSTRKSTMSAPARLAFLSPSPVKPVRQSSLWWPVAGTESKSLACDFPNQRKPLGVFWCIKYRCIVRGEPRLAVQKTSHPNLRSAFRSARRRLLC